MNLPRIASAARFLASDAEVIDHNVEAMPLGALINLLFLLLGDSGSIGSFSGTFGSTIQLVGREMMWLEPPAKKAAEASVVLRVQ